MTKQTLSTRALLACGAIAGPMYVAVTLIQALTRDGFDLTQHRFTLLTAGELGWIHQLNMVLVGALTVLFAVGVSRMLAGKGRGAVWAPRLIGLLGLAYFAGGLLSADPVAGFPVGTTPELVQTTLQGRVQNATRGISTVFLFASSFAIATWFASQGRRGSAWFFATAIPLVFLALTGVGFILGGNRVGLAFLTTPWIWVTLLAAQLYRLEPETLEVDCKPGPVPPHLAV